MLISYNVLSLIFNVLSENYITTLKSPPKHPTTKKATSFMQNLVIATPTFSATHPLRSLVQGALRWMSLGPHKGGHSLHLIVLNPLPCYYPREYLHRLSGLAEAQVVRPRLSPCHGAVDPQDVAGRVAIARHEL